MIYQELAAPGDLDSMVVCFWRFHLEAGDPSPIEHTVPPDGTVSIAWISGTSFTAIVGPRLEALRVEVFAGSFYFGIRLRPGVAGPLLGVSVPSLRGLRVPFPQVSPQRAKELTDALRPLIGGPLPEFEVVSEAMAEAVRKWRSQTGAECDLLVQTLVNRMIQNPLAEIRELVDGLDVGYRQILRRFEKETGLKPKEFMRLRRVRDACLRALDSGEAVDWAGISAASGFADQPHLSRELRWAFGWPPRLVLEYLNQIEHRDVHPNL